MAEPAATLSISTEHPEEGVVVITVRGELEFGTAAPLRTTLLDVSHGDVATVVVDLADIEFVDSTGLSLLVQAKQRFETQDCRFLLRNPTPRVVRVLEIAGLAGVFAIEDQVG